MEEQEKIIEDRKRKLKEFFVKKNLWIILGVVVALILGIYIRSLPMTDHGGHPGLWDVTTNTWTLGPDLDPFLFLRYAKDMINGGLPSLDTMRNVPLGFKTSEELQMVPYMIVLTYKLVNLFGSYDINFAAVIMPVIFFGLTIISFFLFVREVFVRKDEKNLKANLIALISTFFMVVIPVFLSRTVAGIPEKESVGFFFMFLSFYLFLKAWKSEKSRNSIILAVLAGISTALMGLAWGGVVYLYTGIGSAVFIAFILNKMGKKQTLIYSLWLFVSWAIMLASTGRFGIGDLITSLDTGLAFVVWFILMIHLIIWNTQLSKIKFLHGIKLPKNVVSIIFAIVLGILGVSVIFGPDFIFNKIIDFNNIMFHPITGRWSTTVAENRQPYFTEWGSSFGPFIQGIPIMFWLFFIGSIVLVRKMFNKIKGKDAWILTGLYVLFFLGLVFSRYSATSILNGEDFISKLFYYGSAILFFGSMIYYYVKYNKEHREGFEKIEFEFIFMFMILILCLFTARSAVRLIMTLGPVAPIFASYLVVELIYGFKNSKDETQRIMLGIAALVVVGLLIFTFWSYYNDIKTQSYYYVPNYYTQQWQEAMSWVRNETPQNAVFAHWWDYGYWVQSIGNRATVTDGGNAITWWNYLTGRFVLTGDNQQDALNFLWNHNATYLLIDPTDIGKYGAYSQIGSNKDFDRLSWIPTMTYDPSQIQETNNGTVRIYQGGSAIDEDIVYNNSGTQIFLPSQKAAIVGIIIETKQEGSLFSLKQPQAVFYYEGKQIEIPLRYAYYNNQIFDFKIGLEGTADVIPEVYQTNQGIQIDNMGGLMYLSPRIMKGMMAQVYLLDDPFNKFPNFKIAHSEPSLIVNSLRQQNATMNDFILFNGEVQGPIKIWSISYTGNEKPNAEYLLKTPPSTIDWKF